MATLSLRLFPDSILLQPTQAVTSFDASLHQLTKDMLDTMYQHAGIGLAAPQVGDLRAVLVMDALCSSDDYQQILHERSKTGETIAHSRRPQRPRVMVNPQLLHSHGSHIGEEGCLSLPQISVPVTRAATVDICYQDVEGSTHEASLADLEAICFQHELDHLQGKLILDYQPLLQRQRLKKQLIRQARESAAAVST